MASSREKIRRFFQRFFFQLAPAIADDGQCSLEPFSVKLSPGDAETATTSKWRVSREWFESKVNEKVFSESQTAMEFQLRLHLDEIMVISDKRDSRRTATTLYEIQTQLWRESISRKLDVVQMKL